MFYDTQVKETSLQCAIMFLLPFLNMSVILDLRHSDGKCNFEEICTCPLCMTKVVSVHLGVGPSQTVVLCYP